MSKKTANQFACSRLILPEGVQRIALPEIIRVKFPSHVLIGFPAANTDPTGKQDE